MQAKKVAQKEPRQESGAQTIWSLSYELTLKEPIEACSIMSPPIPDADQAVSC